MLLALVLVVSGSALAQGESCAIPADELAWTQRALDAWERGSRDVLRASPAPLPWIVMVGPRCAWHLAPAPDASSFVEEAAALSGGHEVLPGWKFAGRSVAVVAVPHAGRALLPDGSRAGDPPVGFANMRRQGKETFLAISTLEAWRRSLPQASEADRQGFFLGTFSHEIVHTRQLLPVAREARRIARRYGVPPDVDPYAVQSTFRKKKRYVEAYQAERDLFFRAAAEPDAAQARALATQALGLAEQRRREWLVGRRAWMGELDPLVLSMEGLAEWCRYRLLTDDPAEPRSDAELLALVRGQSKRWAHDEGLALFLLIDRFAPGWQAGIFEGTPRSPFVVLAEAIQ